MRNQSRLDRTVGLDVDVRKVRNTRNLSLLPRNVVATFIVAAGDGELGPAERVPPGDRHPPVRGQHCQGGANQIYCGGQGDELQSEETLTINLKLLSLIRMMSMI